MGDAFLAALDLSNLQISSRHIPLTMILHHICFKNTYQKQFTAVTLFLSVLLLVTTQQTIKQYERPCLSMIKSRFEIKKALGTSNN